MRSLVAIIGILIYLGGSDVGAAPNAKLSCASAPGFERVLLQLIPERDGKFSLEFLRTNAAGETQKFKLARALRCRFAASDARVASCVNSPLDTGDARNSYFASELVARLRVELASGSESRQTMLEVRALSPATLAAHPANPYFSVRGELSLDFAPEECVSHGS